MTVYPRTAARTNNQVKLNRNFYNDGTLYDPFTIDRIEIWEGRYDTEFETKYPGVLRKEILYGSRITFFDISNNILDTIGLTPGVVATDNIYVREFEYPFANATTLTINHYLQDRYPVVTVYSTVNNQIIIPDSVVSVNENTITVNFAIPMSGIVDILGATDDAQVGVSTTSLAKRYIDAFVSEQTIVVTHNLNDTSPIVYVWDSSYQQIWGATVEIIDANSLRVTLGSAMSGEIVVMGGLQGNSFVGFGSQAVIRGTISENYTIITNSNDKLLIKVGTAGIDQTITLTQRCNVQLADIISDINSQLVGAKAYISDVDSTKLMIKTDGYGANAKIELKVIANAAYNTLGLAVGIYNGLGYEPAYSIGSKTGTFPLTPTSYQMTLNFGTAGWWTVSLPQTATNATTIAQYINNWYNLKYLTSGVVYAEVTTDRKIKLKAVGGSIEIAVCPNEAYAEIGFAVGTYLTDQTSTNAETYEITSANQNLRFVVNYDYEIIDVSFTTGSRTAQQLVDEINAEIATLGLTEIVEAVVTTGVAGGLIEIDVLVNDGIKRTGIGQYYTLYNVPVNFTETGVLWKKFLDVWSYIPAINYNSQITDDTDNFIVYADNYFLDSGFLDYNYNFTLLNDTFIKGEKRYISTELTALPKYKTPTVNEWILPISLGQYRIVTSSDLELVPWTNVDVNTGKQLKVMLDTNNSIYRDGVYKIYFKLVLPEGSTIISSSNMFRITAK